MADFVRLEKKGPEWQATVCVRPDAVVGVTADRSPGHCHVHFGSGFSFIVNGTAAEVAAKLSGAGEERPERDRWRAKWIEAHERFEKEERAKERCIEQAQVWKCEADTQTARADDALKARPAPALTAEEREAVETLRGYAAEDSHGTSTWTVVLAIIDRLAGGAK